MRNFLLSLSLVALSTSAFSQAQIYKLHPVFIFSFTRYIQWPDAANGGDFVIKVVGDSPIIAELEAMAKQKKAGDRTIKIMKVATAAQADNCSMVFIPAAQSGTLNDVIQKIGVKPTLIVTEEAGMAAKGSDINFITKDGKLAFELNQTPINKKGLKVSTELTRLAILI